MAILFQDTFEGEASGLPSWSSTAVVGSGASVVADGASALDGAQGLHAVVPALAQASLEARALKTITFPASKILYYRGKFKLVSQVTGSGFGHFVSLYVGSTLVAMFWYTGSFNDWRFNATTPAGDINTPAIIASGGAAAIPAGTAVTLEFIWDQAGTLSLPGVTAGHAGIQFWLNGTSQGTYDLGATGTVYSVDTLKVGAYENTQSWSGEVYHDDVVLADAYTPAGSGLTAVAVDDGLALVAGGGGHRVDFTGSGTTWLTTAPTITVSTGTLGAITVDSDTTAHATYTPGAASGTTTFTDTTDGSSTATLSVLAAATGYSLAGPTSGTTGSASTAFTAQLTPSGSASETAITVTPAISPDGTVSGTVTLAARTANASGTFTVTPAANGAHTISVTNSGSLSNPTSLTYTSSSGPVAVAVTDVNLFWSPFNWRLSGSTYAQTNQGGAYCRLGFSGTSLSVGLDVSLLSGGAVPAAEYPLLAWVIDGGLRQTALLTSGQTTLSLATGLAAGSHTLLLIVLRFNLITLTIDRWTTPVRALRITGFTLDTGAATSAPALRPKRLLWYGDSLGEGRYAADTDGVIPTDASDDDALVPLWWDVADALDAEVGVVAFGSQCLAYATANGNVPPLVNASAVGTAGCSWGNYDNADSRLTGGLLSPAPDYVVEMLGTNDAGASGSTITSAINTYFANLRGAAPSAWVWAVVPPNRTHAADILAATPSDGKTQVIDLDALSTGEPAHLGLNGSASWLSVDGTHPNPFGHAKLGAVLGGHLRSAVSGGAAGNTTSVSWRGAGGFLTGN